MSKRFFGMLGGQLNNAAVDEPRYYITVCVHTAAMYTMAYYCVLWLCRVD